MTAPYRVVVTGLARAQFRALASSSLYNLGQKELTRAMRQIGQRLAHSPRSIGDPLYHLRAAKLEVRGLSHASLDIAYAVHESEPLVIIRSVTSYPGTVP